MSRVLLSTADVTASEEAYVLDALRSGWVTPLGPHVDAFEREVAERVDRRHALALCSGTAALHLGLLGLGAGQGTVVLCPSMTFAASANAIVYTGAEPVFVDSDEHGNVDPDLLLYAADELQAAGHRVSAALVVDLFGRCADYATLLPGLASRGIPVLEDAAEAFGATQGDRAAGSFGEVSILSFNGNKIMTTSGGGMLLSGDEHLVQRARYLSTQARQPAPWYEHTEIGYNYRLSNLLAALGRGQLSRLNEMVDRRRHINSRYVGAIGGLPGVRFLGHPEAPDQRDTFWLSCLELQPDLALRASELIEKLAAEDIEARHLWKPMHLQAAFSGSPAYLTGTAERLFTGGVALPSGSALSDSQVDRVIATILTVVAHS